MSAFFSYKLVFAPIDSGTKIFKVSEENHERGRIKHRVGHESNALIPYSLQPNFTATLPTFSSAIPADHISVAA